MKITKNKLRILFIAMAVTLIVGFKTSAVAFSFNYGAMGQAVAAALIPALIPIFQAENATGTAVQANGAGTVAAIDGLGQSIGVQNQDKINADNQRAISENTAEAVKSRQVTLKACQEATAADALEKARAEAEASSNDMLGDARDTVMASVPTRSKFLLSWSGAAKSGVETPAVRQVQRANGAKEIASQFNGNPAFGSHLFALIAAPNAGNNPSNAISPVQSKKIYRAMQNARTVRPSLSNPSPGMTGWLNQNANDISKQFAFDSKGTKELNRLIPQPTGGAELATAARAMFAPLATGQTQVNSGMSVISTAHAASANVALNSSQIQPNETVISEARFCDLAKGYVYSSANLAQMSSWSSEELARRQYMKDYADKCNGVTETVQAVSDAIDGFNGSNTPPPSPALMTVQ